jgi:hypothetical protein
MLLWILGCLSLQEIRRCLMDQNSEFQAKLIQYLESTHVGKFLTGTQSKVIEKVAQNSHSEGWADPTQTLPKSPPTGCNDKCNHCPKCKAVSLWNNAYIAEVDDLISKSNVHRCSRIVEKDRDNSHRKVRQYVGCTDNKWGNCKACFLHPVVEQTQIDIDLGALTIKKLEAMINTLTRIVTFLFCCNTDITSLKSETAIKAVILYVTDYVTKSSLKTHVIFDVMQAVYQKNSELIGGTEARKDKAQHLMTKIVNNLSAKLEIGTPIVCLYLLKNPDHYTNYKFVTFYWKSYLRLVGLGSPMMENTSEKKVTLLK